MFTFALVSAPCWLLEIWQFSRWGATGELEVEFKLQRHSRKLSFLFPLHPQSAPETELARRLVVTKKCCIICLKNQNYFSNFVSWKYLAAQHAKKPSPTPRRVVTRLGSWRVLLEMFQEIAWNSVSHSPFWDTLGAKY